MPSWLLPAALAAIGAAAAVLSSWAGRAPPAPAGTTRLGYGPRIRTWVSMLLALPFLAGALAAWRFPPGEEPERFWPLAVVASLAFLFLWVGRIEVMGVGHRVTPEALEVRSPWRGAASVPWGEVASVAWSAANQGFEVRGKDGATVRISRWLEGLPALAAALEAHGVILSPEVKARLPLKAGGQAA